MIEPRSSQGILESHGSHGQHGSGCEIALVSRDSVIFGLAGVFFGILVGWIIGSQQNAAPRVAAPAAERAAGSGQSTAAPLDESRAAALAADGKRKPAGCRGAARARQPLFRLGAIRRCRALVRAGDRHRAAQRQRQHRSRHQLLLHEPAGSRAPAVRPLAGDRPASHQDAAERRHRPRVRERRSRGGGARRGSGSWSMRRTRPKGSARNRPSTAFAARIPTCREAVAASGKPARISHGAPPPSTPLAPGSSREPSGDWPRVSSKARATAASMVRCKVGVKLERDPGLRHVRLAGQGASRCGSAARRCTSVRSGAGANGSAGERSG